MKKFQSFTISTNLEPAHLTKLVEQAIDFDYRKKIGTMEIHETYYGNKIKDGTYRVWRKPFIRQGLFDTGFTESFLLKINETDLTIRFSRSWLERILIYGGVSFFTLLIANEYSSWPIWAFIAILSPIFILHHVILRLTDKSIVESFKKILSKKDSI